MQKVILILIGLIMGWQGVAGAVGSSGFENATLGARGLSRGDAVTADPEDASTLAFNPAGLSKLEGNQAYLGPNLFLTKYNYDGLGTLKDEGASRSLIATAYSYVKMDTPIEKLDLGIGANSPFGLITHYSSTGNFAHVAYWNEFKSLAYHLSFSYQLFENLSIGAGWSHVEAKLKQIGKFNRNLLAGTTNHPEFEYDVEGEGNGYNLGLLWDVDESNAIGLYYRSEIRTALEGSMSTHHLDGTFAAVFGTANHETSAKTNVTLPANVTAAWNHRFNEKLDYAVEVSWTGWGSFDHIQSTFGNSNAVLAGFEKITRDFSDTWSVNTGGSYQLNPEWTLNAGYYWQQMAANPLNYTNEIPDADRHGLSVGFSHQINERTALDFAYLLVLYEEAQIGNTAGSSNLADVDGTYSGHMHIWSVGLKIEI